MPTGTTTLSTCGGIIPSFHCAMHAPRLQAYLEASSFANNTAGSGGALSLGEGATLLAVDATWSGNSAELDGGAIQVCDAERNVAKYSSILPR